MICVVDYGLGNISAISTILNQLDAAHKVVRNRDELVGAKKLILPGVGAFDHAITLLEQSGMKSTLNELVLADGIPVLGICVGMQMMADASEEGHLGGLGWINGIVKRIDVGNLKMKPHLPHLGWNLAIPKGSNILFKNVNLHNGFYFLHSYHFSCTNPQHSTAESFYGSKFTSVVNKDDIYGVQFHPEKSHSNGIEMLKNFAYF